MKKWLCCCLACFMAVFMVADAERLFDYRGVFPAQRPAGAKITNYMLLKKGSQISFEVEEQGRGLTNRILIPKIKLTSDEKVFVENPEGLKSLSVPETGIYEITLVPATNEPGEMRFILKVFETLAQQPVASEVTVIAPPPASDSTPTVIAASASTNQIPVEAAVQVVAANQAAPASAATQLIIATPDAVASAAGPILTDNSVNAALVSSAPVFIGSEPVLLAPRLDAFLNPFTGFRFSLEDVNFIAADKLSQMFQVFLRSADGREIAVEGRRFSPEPDILTFMPDKVIAGAVYNLAISDESLTQRKLYKVAAFPEIMVDFSMSGKDVKARVYWNRSIDLLVGPEGQVEQLTGSLLIVKKGEVPLASFELNNDFQPLGAKDQISYRAQPCEIELTMPAEIFADNACVIEVKAYIDGNSEMVQVRNASYKPVIEVEDLPEPLLIDQTATPSTTTAPDEHDFSDIPAVDSENRFVAPEVEEIQTLENLPASSAFRLEKSFSVVSSDQEALSAWPQDAVWGETGGIWVLDSQLRRVARFNRDGALVKTFGQKGDEPGGLGLPVAMALRNSNLYLVDTTRRSIHIFAEDGTYKSVITGDPSTGGNIELPCGISFRKNEMWIVDRNQARILCFNDQGAFLGSFGSTTVAPILSPAGIRADSDALFIRESNGLVKKFSPM
ncbi:MAG: hypothetical protein PHD82_13475, partial [Candidatus Riflebacteria bacterium]|nr:hypothetical protein [Candidatus Riflebacteria bacterium]